MHRFVLTKVELLLGRICLPFAALAPQPGQELLDRQVQLGILLRERFARSLQVHEGCSLLGDQRVAGRQVLRQRRGKSRCILHDH